MGKNQPNTKPEVYSPIFKLPRNLFFKTLSNMKDRQIQNTFPRNQYCSFDDDKRFRTFDYKMIKNQSSDSLSTFVKHEEQVYQSSGYAKANYNFGQASEGYNRYF